MMEKINLDCTDIIKDIMGDSIVTKATLETELIKEAFSEEDLKKFCEEFLKDFKTNGTLELCILTVQFSSGKIVEFEVESGVLKEKKKKESLLEEFEIEYENVLLSEIEENSLFLLSNDNDLMQWFIFLYRVENRFYCYNTISKHIVMFTNMTVEKMKGLLKISEGAYRFELTTTVPINKNLKGNFFVSFDKEEHPLLFR